jgi:hypothetical protein
MKQADQADTALPGLLFEVGQDGVAQLAEFGHAAVFDAPVLVLHHALTLGQGFFDGSQLLMGEGHVSVVSGSPTAHGGADGWMVMQQAPH